MGLRDREAYDSRTSIVGVAGCAQAGCGAAAMRERCEAPEEEGGSRRH